MLWIVCVAVVSFFFIIVDDNSFPRVPLFGRHLELERGVNEVVWKGVNEVVGAGVDEVVGAGVNEVVGAWVN